MLRKNLEELFSRKSKKPESLGIHVGRNSLTVVRVAMTPRGIEVLQLFSEPLLRDPAGWPVELVASKLRAARHLVDVKADDARMTVASDIAPTHFFVIPRMKGEQFESAVKLQLENKWGGTSGELSYQFRTIEKRGDRCRVLAPSIPTERLRLILGSFLDVNCRIDSMEVEGVSLCNLLAYCKLAGTEPVGILQVDLNSGEFYVLRRRSLVLSRSIAKLDADITRADEVDPQSQPEAARDEEGGGGLGAARLGRIVREANKTLDYFEVELLSPAVENLILVGECARAPDLAESLEAKLEVAVALLDSAQHVHDATGRYEPTLHGLAVAAAIGEVAPNEN